MYYAGIAAMQYVHAAHIDDQSSFRQMLCVPDELGCIPYR